jgi:hypothetical protein
MSKSWLFSNPFNKRIVVEVVGHTQLTSKIEVLLKDITDTHSHHEVHTTHSTILERKEYIRIYCYILVTTRWCVCEMISIFMLT